MFLAVIKRVTYTYPKEGETDKRGHTAVEVFDKKLGCGGLQHPRRLHAQHGDPGAHRVQGVGRRRGSLLVGVLSAGQRLDSVRRLGRRLVRWSLRRFGNQFDLNARMAFMRGNTFDAGNYETSAAGPGVAVGNRPGGEVGS